MPDVGTPQATWRDDPEFLAAWGGYSDNLAFDLADDAVAADRRIQAVTHEYDLQCRYADGYHDAVDALRAKIEALREVYIEDANEAAGAAHAVLDAVLGGDS